MTRRSPPPPSVLSKDRPRHYGPANGVSCTGPANGFRHSPSPLSRSVLSQDRRRHYGPANRISRTEPAHGLRHSPPPFPAPCYHRTGGVTTGLAMGSLALKQPMGLGIGRAPLPPRVIKGPAASLRTGQWAPSHWAIANQIQYSIS
jgi:hypothetical protein